MALHFISNETIPNYIAVSTDIVDSKIEGASLVGKLILTTDDYKWYVIEEDLTLTPYALPIVLGGSITIGEVAQGSASLVESWRVNITSGSASIDQNVQVDPGNSSDDNLAAGGVFTGTSLNTLKVSGIQVSLKTSQNCLVEVQQSPDNINWDITDNFNYNVLKDNFGVTVQAVSSYVRVRVTNLNSTAGTTYFRLQTVLCPTVEALPRSLDAHGHLKSTVIGLEDHFGFDGQFSPVRDLRVAEPYKLVGTTLGATIDPNGIIATTSGSGAVATVSNSIAIVSSGSSNSGYGQLQSKTKARYIYGQPHAWRGVGRLSVVGVPNCTRRLGMFDTSGSNVPNDGAYFEFSSTGVLSVNTVSGGSVSNSVSNGSFNGDVSEYTLDTNVHTYEIIAFTTGVWFYIDNVLIHSIKPTVALLYQSLTVPITAQSINSASGTTSGTLEVWNTSISRLGRNITAPVYKYQSGTTAGLNLKLGAGSLHNIIISNITNNANVTLYDSTSATGSVIFSTGPMANNSTPYSIPFGGLNFYNGLTMVISGANCNVTLVYE